MISPVALDGLRRVNLFAPTRLYVAGEFRHFVNRRTGWFGVSRHSLYHLGPDGNYWDSTPRLFSKTATNVVGEALNFDGPTPAARSRVFLGRMPLTGLRIFI